MAMVSPMAGVQHISRRSTAATGQKSWLGGGFFIAAIVACATLPLVPGQTVVRAEDAAAETAEKEAVPEPETVINANEMDYDFEKRVSTYKGDVRIEHGTLVLTADNMTVTHGDDHQPVRIEALGSVTIVDGDKSASGERAEYIMESQQVTLTGKPHMRQGPNSLTGAERLIYRQEVGEFTAEGGRPSLTLYRNASSGSLLPGDDADKGSDKASNEPK